MVYFVKRNSAPNYSGWQEDFLGSQVPGMAESPCSENGIEK